MEYEAHQLAAARANLETANRVVAEIQSKTGVLTQRLAGVRGKYSESLAAMRSGSLAENIAAVRMAAANADATDLEAMINELHVQFQEADQARQHAERQVRSAERIVELEELRLVGVGLDAEIKKIETALCVALAERYRIHAQSGGNGSLFNIWSPTVALRRAVVENLPPEVHVG